MGRFIKEAPYDAERERLKADGDLWKICRWCGKELSGRRTAWCSDACSDEFSIRLSGSTARWMVRRRDRGVCAVCGVNTLAIHYQNRKLWGHAYGGEDDWKDAPAGYAWDRIFLLSGHLERDTECSKWNKAPDHAAHVVSFYGSIWKEHLWRIGIGRTKRVEALQTWRRFLTFMEERGWTRSRLEERSEPWDADHIETVHDGGGGCGLDNYQTLCLPCHKKKNAEHARLRAQQRSPQQSLVLEA